MPSYQQLSIDPPVMLPTRPAADPALLAIETVDEQLLNAVLVASTTKLALLYELSGFVLLNEPPRK